jgi:hypothetical protein
MKVITVKRYNVLSKILTACFETQKGEPLAEVDTSVEFYMWEGGVRMKDVMFQWRAVFEASVIGVHSRVCGLLLSIWSGVLKDGIPMNSVILIHVQLNFFLLGEGGGALMF